MSEEGNALTTIQGISQGRARTLFTEDNAGRLRVWGCWAHTNSVGTWGIYYTDGIIDGKVKSPTFKASKEKNVGKVNFMSIEMQAHAMVEQEFGKKMKDNYFESEQLAHDLKMFKPMLCPSGMKWKDYKAGGKKAKKVVYPILVSAKLDGARANMGFTGETFLVNASLITDTAIVPGTYPMLSRESRPWLNFEHIRDDHYFQEFLRDYPNIILDGEMYNHDFKDEFEGLISVFRKQKPTPEQRIISAGVSKFYVYDIYDKAKPNLTALERQKVLIGIYENYFKSCDLFVPVLSKVVKNEAEFDAFHEDCMDKGYEGTIARLIDSPYGIDSRSGDLLKRKDVFDCEFTITGVIEGEGNKAGTAQKVVIELGTAEGMNEDDLAKLDELGTQKAGMARGWDNAKCKVVLENPDRYIGKVGTFEYFGITNHGKLRFPKFKALREPFSY